MNMSGIIIVKTFFCFAFLLLGGCHSSRLSYKYNDGVPYTGLSGKKLLQKVYIRSLRFENEMETRDFQHSNIDVFRVDCPDVRDLSRIVPEMFSAEESADTFPVDVTVHFHGKTFPALSGGEILMCLIPTLPIIEYVDRAATVTVRASGKSEPLVASDSLVCRYSNKITFFSFFALFKFSPSPDCQENIRGSFLMTDDNRYEIVAAFNRSLARCIAQQLKAYALERLTVPKIDFTIDEGL